MRRWWAAHAADRDGERPPGSAEFGLDLDEVRARFADYTDPRPAVDGEAR